jgi:hypothetical protein
MRIEFSRTVGRRSRFVDILKDGFLELEDEDEDMLVGFCII